VSASSDPEDPWLYNSYKQDHEEKVGRIHLGRLADEGEIETFLHEALKLSVSPDGMTLYTDKAASVHVHGGGHTATGHFFSRS
jgi:hypothetical protein